MRRGKTLSFRLILGLLGCLLLPGRSLLGAEPVYYGGIEIGGKGVKMVAIPIDDAGAPILNLLQSNDKSSKARTKARANNVTLGALSPEGFFQESALEDVFETVKDYHSQLSTGIFSIPPERLWIVASSGLTSMDRPKNFDKLREAVFKATGGEEKLIEIDQHEEVVNLIRGTVTAKDLPYTVLLDIGSSNSKLGYYEEEHGVNQARHVANSAKFEGTTSFNAVIENAMPPGGAKDFSVRLATMDRLRARFQAKMKLEVDRKPGLLNRPRIALVGGCPFAIATLTNLESMMDDRIYCEFSVDRLRTFQQQIRETHKVPQPDVSKLPSNLQEKAAREVQFVNGLFTVDQFLAGSELLLSFSEALEWERPNKQVMFVKSGLVAWIVAYVENNRKAKQNP